MHQTSVDHSGDSRVRFVFSDMVVSRTLAADATLEDVARILGDLNSAGYWYPRAIDVTPAGSQCAW